MTSKNSTKRILGPFNRVEGDLEVHIEVEQGVINKAWVNTPLFRGYEQILQGKDPLDALVYTPRICGICSVSQSVAASIALANAQGIIPAINGQLASNIILATENMADHLTHFYLFFMPDFARDCYASKSWFDDTSKRFKAQIGSVLKEVLPARSSFLHITGVLAGKWPHSLAIQPGGTTRPIASQERVQLLTLIKAFRHFLQETLFGCTLEQFSAIGNEAELHSFVEQHPDCDFSRFIRISRDLNLSNLGQATDNFMSYGAYVDHEQQLFKTGTWQQQYHPLDDNDISEDISHSWLQAQSEPKHPYQGSTYPDPDETSGYSWCKAPRLNGNVMEVGAIARQMVDGNPLILDLVNKSGANVQNRIISRLLELALVIPSMESWVKQLRPGEPFCTNAIFPDETQGAGLVEAARGSLGHWLKVKNGKILNYQIIAPTTWNFSPRDGSELPGALEQALQGTEVGDDSNAVVIQHIIRSFDPCMVCTVH